MQWLNAPEKWKHEGNTLTATAMRDTDFWRLTHSGYITDNGHFYFQEISGDFTASVKLIGDYRGLYDHAGLMLRIDEKNWIKTGIELVNDVHQVSAVVTRDYSDWSVIALPQKPEALWLKLKRENITVEIEYSLDGSTYRMMRQAYFPAAQPIQAGLMCAAPRGDGFDVRFEDILIGAK